MKAVILAGGYGTRLAEETTIRPKPLVEIGGRPILWHIMKMYAAHGVNDFIVCLGYKGYMIKEYFSVYVTQNCDIVVDLAQGTLEWLGESAKENFRITLVDTGESSMTGGRLRRVRRHLGDEDFCFTYGDGVGNVDITALIDFHRRHGRSATVTAVRPPGRFGAMVMEGDTVCRFEEKPRGDGSWINGGFFVLHPRVIDRIVGDETIWEREPLEELARDDELRGFRHDGFWQPMDTLRDRAYLEELWSGDQAPWKQW